MTKFIVDLCIDSVAEMETGMAEYIHDSLNSNATSVTVTKIEEAPETHFSIIVQAFASLFRVNEGILVQDKQSGKAYIVGHVIKDGESLINFTLVENDDPLVHEHNGTMLWLYDSEQDAKTAAEAASEQYIQRSKELLN